MMVRMEVHVLTESHEFWVVLSQDSLIRQDVTVRTMTRRKRVRRGDWAKRSVDIPLANCPDAVKREVEAARETLHQAWGRGPPRTEG